MYVNDTIASRQRVDVALPKDYLYLESPWHHWLVSFKMTLPMLNLVASQIGVFQNRKQLPMINLVEFTNRPSQKLKSVMVTLALSSHCAI